METIDKVKQMIANGVLKQEDAEKYFPELKESEDEKIRKCIGDVVREYDWAHIFGITKDDCLSWLEKQGKQKSLSITDEWIEDYWQHEKVNNPYSYDKGEEIQFDHQGFVRFCKKYCKGEQKPAWSEEDITHYNRIIEELSIQKEKPINASYVELINFDIDWLKSLKYRVGCEMNCTTTKEWSEEDERYLNAVEELIIGSRHTGYNGVSRKDSTNWLKSLKERVQPKQEWSKEDEEYFNSIAHALSVLLIDPSFDKINLGHTAWFKSLKDRFTWKPSDEQMWALSTLANIPESASDACKKTAKELLEQLKKLREE